MIELSPAQLMVYNSLFQTNSIRKKKFDKVIQKFAASSCLVFGFNIFDEFLVKPTVITKIKYKATLSQPSATVTLNFLLENILLYTKFLTYLTKTPDQYFLGLFQKITAFCVELIKFYFPEQSPTSNNQQIYTPEFISHITKTIEISLIPNAYEIDTIEEIHKIKIILIALKIRVSMMDMRRPRPFSQLFIDMKRDLYLTPQNKDLSDFLKKISNVRSANQIDSFPMKELTEKLSSWHKKLTSEVKRKTFEISKVRGALIVSATLFLLAAVVGLVIDIKSDEKLNISPFFLILSGIFIIGAILNNDNRKKKLNAFVERAGQIQEDYENKLNSFLTMVKTEVKLRETTYQVYQMQKIQNEKENIFQPLTITPPTITDKQKEKKNSSPPQKRESSPTKNSENIMTCVEDALAEELGCDPDNLIKVYHPSDTKAEYYVIYNKTHLKEIVRNDAQKLISLIKNPSISKGNGQGLKFLFGGKACEFKWSCHEERVVVPIRDIYSKTLSKNIKIIDTSEAKFFGKGLHTQERIRKALGMGNSNSAVPTLSK